jgi:hypothetical protein
VLLRANDHAPLHRLARLLRNEPLPAGVELSIDIDPAALG